MQNQQQTKTVFEITRFITRNILLSITFLILNFTLLIGNSYAIIPGKINLQGYLTDNQGEYRQGTYNLTFSIWKDATSTNINDKLWTESHTNVTVTKGVFQVFLGNVVTFPTDLFDGTDELWLEIQVENDTPMVPRQKFVSVPYSLLTKDIIDNTISTDKLQNNAVTSIKINPGEISNTHISANASISTSKLDGAVTSISNNGLGSLSTKNSISNSDISSSAGISQSKISNSSRTIDADMLDGKQATEFIDTTATAQTKSGGLNITGNVGIGTTNPSQSLDVTGNISLTGTHLIYNSNNGVINFGPTGNLWIRKLNTTGNISDYTNLVTITNNGNVGMGITSPGAKLEIRPGSTDSYALYVGSSNGGPGLYVKPNGNIGIKGNIEFTGEWDLAETYPVANGEKLESINKIGISSGNV